MQAVIDWLETLCNFFSGVWEWLSTPLFQLDFGWLSSLGVQLPEWLQGGLSVTPLALTCTALIFGLIFVGLAKTFLKWW